MMSVTVPFMLAISYHILVFFELGLDCISESYINELYITRSALYFIGGTKNDMTSFLQQPDAKWTEKWTNKQIHIHTKPYILVHMIMRRFKACF